MLLRSPDLKMGITFANFSWVGTRPFSNESVKMWCSGLIMVLIIFLRRFVEIPLWSGVFLLARF